MSSVRESYKPSSDKYELIWDESGFPVGEIRKVFTAEAKYARKKRYK
jgi:hypothetical protein